MHVQCVYKGSYNLTSTHDIVSMIIPMTNFRDLVVLQESVVQKTISVP